MKKVLLYVEEKYVDDTLGLFEAAKQLYPNEEIEVYALFINFENEKCYDGFCNKIISIKDKNLKFYDQKAISDIFDFLNKEYSFDAILFLATLMGRCIAPSVAMKLNTGIVADVCAVSNDNNKINLIRPAYSGKIMASINIIGSGPIVMSVHSQIFDYKIEKKVLTQYVSFSNLKLRYSNIKLLKQTKKEVEYDIRESDILLSSGGGCTDIEKIKELSSLLNAQVSASRAVVDQKIMPRAMQVGQSGKTVSPSLYVALGIHGALQHVEGLKDIDYIISVNTNINAPICSISDIVVNGDASLFLSKLIEKIEIEAKNE